MADLGNWYSGSRATAAQGREVLWLGRALKVLEEHVQRCRTITLEKMP